MAEGQVRVHVVRKQDGWIVEREGAARATGVYSRSQTELSEFEAVSVAVRAEEALPAGRFTPSH